MKILIPAIVAVMLLSGCSPASKSPMPAIDKVQEKAMLADLKAVNAAYSDTRGLIGAQLLCRNILRGTPETDQVAFVQSRFSMTETRMPETEARRVIEVIKSNGFCKQA